MENNYICANCGGQFKKPDTKGENFFGCMWFINFLVFIVVGCFFNVIIGISILIIYILIGSLNKQKKICPYCKNENCFIPIDTPKGQELYKKFNVNTSN